MELPNGIPSHDTLGACSRCWTYSSLSAASRLREDMLMDWVSAVSEFTKGEVIEIEAKRKRAGRDEKYLLKILSQLTQCASFQFSSSEICRGGLPPVCTGAGSELDSA